MAQQLEMKTTTSATCADAGNVTPPTDSGLPPMGGNRPFAVSTATSDAESLRESDNDYEDDFEAAAVQKRKQQDEQLATARAIAKDETRAVYYGKSVVFLVLLISTVGVAVAVYLYMAGNEQTGFKGQFAEDVEKVFSSIGTSLDLTLGTTDSFMVNLVSYARYSNSTWPLVTLPDFAVKAAKVRSLSQSAVIGYYPKVTSAEDRAAWEAYSVTHDQWVNQGIAVQKEDPLFYGTNVEKWQGFGLIHGNEGPIEGPGPYFPTWTTAPVVPYYSPYNWDLYDLFSTEINAVMTEKRVLIGLTTNLPDPGGEYEMKDWIKNYIAPDEDPTEPLTVIYYPVIDKAADHVTLEHSLEESEVVGLFAITKRWREFITNILPHGSDGIVVVFGNACNQSFSYQIMGPHVQFLGKGDRHDPKYDDLMHYSAFSELEAFTIRERTYTGIPLSDAYCPYWIKAYPSDVMRDQYITHDPALFTAAAVLIFVFTSLVFLVYDYLNERRQQKVMSAVMQSNAIISSLFPTVVRDRLFSMNKNNQQNSPSTGMATTSMETPKLRLQSYLLAGRSGDASQPHDGKDNLSSDPSNSAPIAELFPETTVMFADIAGFTAWSSVREPSKVFTLLEAIYGAFDALARRRGVFKVETIGDSYVAVTGLPEPNREHAIVMARFARDCRNQMTELVRQLEITLGPGTGDLQMRIGLNSGPVTAGVLRGERSRFQLFGDTVNTAARMESTGQRSWIQVSQSTADLLVAAGKQHWVTPRDGLVEAKGKGKMQTYWVEPQSAARSVKTTLTTTTSSDKPELVPDGESVLDDTASRLVGWNVDVFTKLLQQIVAHREASVISRKSSKDITQSTPLYSLAIDARTNGGHTVLDEVKEIIELPEFDPKTASRRKDPHSVELDPQVVTELTSFVTAVANMYHHNPFHNFEHASHVTMSVVKLLNRIVAPDGAYDESRESGGKKDIASTLHDHTYGITSDPLTQFACVFSALIHDVDHPGVPNTQLIQENSPLAAVYHNKSIAEQNSVDLAWNLFMADNFANLRGTICACQAELRRFRELVVNTVMATDIMDKDLKVLRNARWDKAFAENAYEASSREAVNRKATIVLEHLIQASDVAHTMQHWHIYRKWNERLFEEMYVAYQAGRLSVDPSENWFIGEIGFFDFYIIPLAKKLRDCGVFGVSSDEYLNYATKNRAEWEEKGPEAVAAMIEKVKTKQSQSLIRAYL